MVELTNSVKVAPRVLKMADSSYGEQLRGPNKNENVEKPERPK